MDRGREPQVGNGAAEADELPLLTLPEPEVQAETQESLAVRVSGIVQEPCVAEHGQHDEAVAEYRVELADVDRLSGRRHRRR
jgi:hypothetical protein